MCAVEVEKPQTGAEGVRWRLEDLYQSTEDPQIAQGWEEATRRAQAFEQNYRGKINAADLTSDRLVAALEEYEAISELQYKPLVYASLVFSADTTKGPFMQVQRERSVALANHLRFFELELAAADDAIIDSFIDAPALQRFRHYVEVARLYRPYLLSEAEERIDSEKGITGRSAWVRYFEEVVSQIKVSFELKGQKQEMPLDSALKFRYDPDRETRQITVKAITEALQAHAHPLTFVFNTVVYDHAIEDRLRNRPSMMTERNLSNEIDDETVEALFSACENNVDIVHRYYRLKGKLLGYELTNTDIYAPLMPDEARVTYSEAQDIILNSFKSFSPDMAQVAGYFFEKNWIDAEPRERKSGGAFSSPAVPSVHPYILMNFTGRRDDVNTLAHELGHGIHQYVSREKGVLGGAYTTLTLAEMASVFCEMIVFYDLLEREQDPQQRLAMLTGKLESIFATVFRQAIMGRFEQKMHEARRSEGELSTERINQIWMETQKHMFGDSVTLTDDYNIWWGYIGHFIRSPFYVYAYAFGELLVLALYQKYRNEGQDFVPRYLNVLKAGGSDWPQKILAEAGVDITEKSFWQQGLDLIRSMVEDAERAAAESGMLKS